MFVRKGPALCWRGVTDYTDRRSLSDEINTANREREIVRANPEIDFCPKLCAYSDISTQGVGITKHHRSLFIYPDLFISL